MDTPETIESLTAHTILQQTETIKVGAKTYDIAPPSTATLILASEAVSLLPKIKLDEEHIIEEALKVAKDCRKLGDVVAILILGAKHINDCAMLEQTAEKRPWWAFWRKREVASPILNAKDALAKELLEELTPRDLYSLAAKLLKQMQLGDFFGLTTFLIEINLIRPTKVETAPTASGQ